MRDAVSPAVSSKPPVFIADASSSCAAPMACVKVSIVERDVTPMASKDFSVVFLRNATAYGPSPRMRFDIVLNDLCALARTTGRIAMVSDGSPWRPIVHVEDICEAMRCAVEAPADAINGEVFNVGRTLDEGVRTPEGLKFAVRLVVYDSEMILNSLIYPI